MPADIILVDFKSRTYHKPETLEQMVVAILDQVDTSPSEMNPGAGIDGLWKDTDPA